MVRITNKTESDANRDDLPEFTVSNPFPLDEKNRENDSSLMPYVVGATLFAPPGITHQNFLELSAHHTRRVLWDWPSQPAQNLSPREMFSTVRYLYRRFDSPNKALLSYIRTTMIRVDLVASKNPRLFVQLLGDLDLKRIEILIRTKSLHSPFSQLEVFDRCRQIAVRYATLLRNLSEAERALPTVLGNAAAPYQGWAVGAVEDGAELTEETLELAQKEASSFAEMSLEELKIYARAQMNYREYLDSPAYPAYKEALREAANLKLLSHLKWIGRGLSILGAGISLYFTHETIMRNDVTNEEVRWSLSGTMFAIAGAIGSFIATGPMIPLLLGDGMIVSQVKQAEAADQRIADNLYRLAMEAIRTNHPTPLNQFLIDYDEEIDDNAIRKLFEDHPDLLENKKFFERPAKLPEDLELGSNLRKRMIKKLGEGHVSPQDAMIQAVLLLYGDPWDYKTYMLRDLPYPHKLFIHKMTKMDWAAFKELLNQRPILKEHLKDRLEKLERENDDWKEVKNQEKSQEIEIIYFG